MNNLYFIISTLLATSLMFSAVAADRSTIDKNGKLNLTLRPVSHDDIDAIKTLSNCFIDRLGQPAMRHMYIQDIMKVPTAYNVMYLATLDMADHDPACAESMLTSFIPKNNNAMSFAILTTIIGGAYYEKQQYDDAARLLISSWQIKPTQHLAQLIVDIQAEHFEYRGMIYWIEQAKRAGYDITPNKTMLPIPVIINTISRACGQKTDFKQDMRDIVDNEMHDFYNPVLLLFREDMKD